MKNNSIKPSDGELEILQELWEKPGQTVKELHSHLQQKKPIGYTTTLKQIQRMLDKKLVYREVDGKIHTYYSAVEEKQVKNSVFNKLADTLFKGSSSNMMLHLLGNTNPSSEELEELKNWIAQQEKFDKK